jgi:hypothetical protein
MKKRFSGPQIVAKLRQADVLIGQGKIVPEDNQDPNAWAKEDIEKASKRLGELLTTFEPYLKEPFDIDGFEKLGDECRKELRTALGDVNAKLKAYINDLTIENGKELCEANRKAIVLLFLNRFARF